MITRTLIENLIKDSKEVGFIYNDKHQFGIFIDSNLNNNFVEPYGTVTISLHQDNTSDSICTGVENIQLLRVY